MAGSLKGKTNSKLAQISGVVTFWAFLAFLSINVHAASDKFRDQPTETPSAETGLKRTQGVVSDAPVSLQSFKTHSRLSIKVDSNAVSHWKETKSGFELLIDGLTLTDIGAPLGSEHEFAKMIERQNNDRLKSLSIQETEAGLLFKGTWRFVEGENGLDVKKMEHFEYRQGEPSRLVVDFWNRPGPTVVEARLQRKRLAERSLLKKIDEETKARRGRRIASEKAREDLEDTTPFCKQSLHPSRDVFLAFLPAHRKFDLGQWFPLATPDRGYAYLRPTASSREAQYVRLALDLYQKGNFALTIKTIEFMKSEHPSSIYAAEMRFLHANALIKLGSEAQANRLLQDILKTSNDSRAAIYAGLYLAKLKFDHAEYLPALEHFQWLSHKYPNHQYNWVFHLGAAESLYLLKQTERATAEYQWVRDHAPLKKHQAEAASAMGDSYMMRGQYDQALAAYFNAVREFKNEVPDVPLVHINRAESLFWLGQLDRAEEEFSSFLKNYPSHPYGWRATYRLGEIFGRREGPDAEKDRETSRRWFSETINRFPFSPGSVLARLRLLPCGDHGGFEEANGKSFLREEAGQFTGDNEVFMRNYQDFRGLTLMRTLIAFKDLDGALTAAIKELQSNARSEARLIIGDTLRAIFRKCILERLDAGKSFEALAFYQEHVASIPKPKGVGELVPSDYLLRLSRATADLGLGMKSEELAKLYRESQEVESQIDRKVAAEDIEVQFKIAEQKFTEAKGMWTLEGIKAEPKIVELLGAIPDESPFSYEKFVLLSLIAEKQKKFSTALKLAKQAQALLPPETGPETFVERARIAAWVGKLESIAGESRLAMKAFAEVDTIGKYTGEGIREDASLKLGLPATPSRDQVLLMLGELYEKGRNWGEAALVYAKAVEAGVGGNQMLYAYAKALDQTANRKNESKSKEIYERIAESDSDDFWRRLARAMLADEQTGKYKPKNANKQVPAQDKSKDLPKAGAAKEGGK